MENNKVNVRIYGQEYTIAGEKDEESIRKIAAHVNSKMKELGKSFSLSGQGTLAVLAAINIADEYFDAVAEADALRAEKEKLREETEQHLRMWEEAKKNFAHYKEAAARADDARKAGEEKYRELEAKCAEFESSYFDLQVENMKIKRELDQYKESDER